VKKRIQGFQRKTALIDFLATNKAYITRLHLEQNSHFGSLVQSCSAVRFHDVAVILGTAIFALNLALVLQEMFEKPNVFFGVSGDFYSAFGTSQYFNSTASSQ